MRRSLRARLTLWNVVNVAAALTLFGVLLYSTFAGRLYSHHDDDLADNAARFIGMFGAARSGEQPADVLRRLDSGAILALLRDSKGHLLFRSRRLANASPEIGEHEALIEAAARTPRGPEFFTVSFPKLGAVRFISLPASAERDTYLQLGQPLGHVEQILGFLRNAMFLLVPIVVVLTSVGGLVIAQRALAPVSAIGRTLEEIQATDLDRRLDVDRRDDELRGLVLALNQLLDRLGRAFTSHREFAADASHQLQTPLAVMKGSVDVALSACRDPATYQAVLEQVSLEIDRLTTVLRDLKTFTLADAGHTAEGGGTTDASTVFRDAADIVQAIGETADVSVLVAVPPGLRVRGANVPLEHIVLNLGDNAVKFSSPHGVVRISAGRENGFVVLEVADSGPGISDRDLPRIFDRFYRGERARGDGSGLGLAIVKRLVDAYGGAIEAANDPAGGAIFRVRLPLVPSD